MKQRCQNNRFFHLAQTGLFLALFFFISINTVWAAALTGKPAPTFVLKDHVGQACSLDAYRGQPVLLKIGTTWCPSCSVLSKEIIQALPELEKLGVAVVEVFVEDSAKDVVRYREKHSFPEAIRTCIDQDDRVLDSYSVVNIPHALVLDSSHVVVKDSYLTNAERLVKDFRKQRTGN